jgi:hypothetical protein
MAITEHALLDFTSLPLGFSNSNQALLLFVLISSPPVSNLFSSKKK